MASVSPLSAVPLIPILAQCLCHLDICSMKVHCKKSGRVLCGLCEPIVEIFPNGLVRADRKSIRVVSDGT